MEIPAPEIVSPQEFCETGTYYLSDILLALGMNVVWYDSETGATELNAATTALVDGATYYAALMIGECESTERSAVEVSLVPEITITPDVTSPQYFCEGAMINSIIVPHTGIVWYATVDGTEPLSSAHKLETGTYYAAITVGEDCESTQRTAVSIVINPVNYDYITDTQSFCGYASIGDISIVGYGLTWYSDEELTIELALDEELIHGLTYYGANTNGDCALISYAVTINIYGDVPPPIVKSPLVLCETEGNLTLADVYIQGSNIRWYSTETGDDPLPLTTPLVTETIYWVSQGVGECESERSYIKVIINSEMEIPAPEIVSPQEFCETGTYYLSDILLALGMNVVWYDSETGTTELDAVTTALVDGATYYAALMIGECESAERSAVEVSLVPEITITPDVTSPQYFCEGAMINSIIVPHTEIVWYATVDGTEPLSSTHKLETGTYYAAIAVSEDCESTQRKAVSIVIDPVNYDYVTETQSFCISATIADISITGYGLTWYSDEELTIELTLDDELTHGSTYYAANTNGDCALIAYAVTIYIYDNVPPPTVMSPIELCSTGGELTLADVYVQGSNIRWYDAQVDGNELPLTTVLTNGSIYWASQSIGLCESERSYVKVIINPEMEVPAPEIVSPQEFCETGGYTLDDIMLSDGMNVIWYNAATDGFELPRTTPLTNGSIYYASLIIGDCESTSRTAVTVEFKDEITIIPVIASPQIFCEGAMISSIDITGYGSDNIVWYATNISTLALDYNHKLATGTYYAAIKVGDDCESTLRLPVSINIEPENYDYETDVQYFCETATIADITIMGYGITWYSDEELTELLDLDDVLTNGATYYAANINGDCGIIAMAVTVYIYDNIPPPTVTTPVELCEIVGNLTLADIHVEGLNIQWYASEDGDDLLPLTTPLVDGTTYWVSQRVATCESARSYVYVKINPEMYIPAPEIDSPIELCEDMNGTVRLMDLPVNGQNIIWYLDSNGTYPVPPEAIIVYSTYYAKQIIGECQSTELTTVNVTFVPVVTTMPDITSPQVFCEGAMITSIDAPANINWYATVNGTQPLTPEHILETGTYYAAYFVGSDCESTQRVAVEIKINPTDYDYIEETQSFCYAATVKDITITGYGITWYTEPELTNVLDLDDELTHGATYYGANTNGDCGLIGYAVTINIYDDVPPPIVTTPVVLCETDGNLTLGYLNNYVQGINIIWYASETSEDALPSTTALVNGTTYWVSQSIGLCEGGRSYIKVVIDDEMIVDPPVIHNPIIFCDNETYTLEDVERFLDDQLNIVWYDAHEEGNLLVPADVTLVNGDVYYAANIIGECESTERTAVVIELVPELTITPNIISPQVFCEGAIISSIHIDGYGSGVIKWYATEDGTEPLALTHILETGTYYAAIEISENCASSQRAAVEIEINPDDYDYIEETQSFCVVGTISDISITGYGLTWYADEALTIELDLDDELTHGATYYAANTNGDCALIAYAVTVNIYDNLFPPTVISPVTLCSTDEELTLADIYVYGIAHGAHIQWYASENNDDELELTTVLVDGGVYWVSQILGGCKSERSYVKVNINNELIVPAPIIVSPQEFCDNDVYYLSDVMLPQGVTVVWYDAIENGNVVNPEATELTDGDVYYAALVIGYCESTERTQVEIIIDTEITIIPEIPSPQYFCEGAMIINIHHGNNNPANINWYTTENGTDTLDNNYILTSGTYYAAITMGEDCESTQRLAVEIIINPDDYDYIQETQAFCGSATVSDISVFGYGITWFTDESLTNELDINDELTHGTTYYGANTNGDCAIISYAVTVTIYNLLPPTVKSPVTLCSTDEELTLADVYVYGIASGAHITWYASETGDDPLELTTVLTNGGIYWVSQSIGTCESERSYVRVIISEPETIPAPIIASPQEFCETGTYTLEDIILPEGMAVVWYETAESSIELVPGNVTLTDGATYYVALVVGYCESTERTAVEITLVPEITIIPEIPSPQYFCEGAMINSINLGNSSSSNITWYASETGTEPLDNNYLLTTGTYYAAITVGNNCESTQRAAVEIEIEPETYDYETGVQDFCANATIADITVMGYGITWYSDEELTDELDIDEELTHGATYYAANVNGDCSLIGYAVTVNVYENINPPIVSSPIELCSTDEEVTLADIPVQGMNITWYASETSTDQLPLTTVLTNGSTYWVSQNIGTCESERSYIKVFINDELEVPAPEIASPQYFCETGTYYLSDIILAPGMSVIWYDAVENGNELDSETTLLVDGGIYYAALMIGKCESTELTAVEVIFNDQEKIELVISDQSFCEGAIIADIQMPYEGISWYYNIDDVEPLSEIARLITHIYYAEISINEDCTVTERVPVNITIGEPEEVITPSEQFFCMGASIEDLEVTGYGVTWYASEVSTIPLPISTILVHGTTYYAANVNGDCVSERVTVTVYLYEYVNPPTLESPVKLCVTDNPGLTLADVKVIQGVNITWYDAEIDGNELPVETVLVDGGVYWASQAIGGCESLRSYVKVEFDPEMIIPAPNIPAQQQFCNQGVNTLGDLITNGYNITWYSAAEGGVMLSDNTLLTSLTTYYAAQTVGECESTERTPVFVILVGNITMTIDMEPQYFCEGAMLSDIIVNYYEHEYAWYATDNSTVELPMNTILETGSYYIALKVGDCVSTERTEVPVTIGEPSLVITESSQEFCGSAIIADLYVLGYGINWYDSEDATDPLPVTTPLVDGTTYYVANSNGECEGERTEVNVAIYPIPEPPVLADDAVAEVCDGDEISVNFLLGLIDIQNNVDYIIYVDEDCTTEFTTAFNTDYSVATSHEFYVRAYYTGTTCAHDVEDALELTITVNPRPVAPVIVGGADTSVCDGETINAALLESLITYDDAVVTVAFYMDAGCTIAFTDITTDYSIAISHTIYVTTINLGTGCETSSEDALELVITVDPRPEAPVIIGGADLSVCDGDVIDETLLESLITYDDAVVTIAFYTDEACTIPFTDITTDYSVSASHTIYVTAINIASECETDSEEALELTITVDPRPASPIFVEDPMLTICEDNLISINLLTALIAEQENVELKFYIDSDCTIEYLGDSMAEYEDSPYTFYAIAHNTVTGCLTSSEDALVITITVNQQPVFITCPEVQLEHTTVPGELSMIVEYIVELDETMPVPVLTYLFEGATEGSGDGSGSGSYFNVGITTVTVTATVEGCESAACEFEIQIYDGNEPPEVDCSEIIALYADENDMIIIPTDPGVSYYTHIGTSWDATATDDVIIESMHVMIVNINTGQILVSYDDALSTLDGFVFHYGFDYQVIWRAMDHAGLYAECEFAVRVIDEEPPCIGCDNGISCETITNYQGVVNICLTALEEVYVHYGISWDVTATDNIAVSSISYEMTGATVGSGTSLNGVSFNVGTTTVTWTVVDINDIESTCSFDVVVNANPSVEVENFIYCDGEEAPEYTFTGDENTTFVWQRIIGFDLGLPVTSGVNTIPEFTATNEGFESITAIYSVTPVSGECQGEVQYFMITVNPRPVTSLVEDMIYCNGVTAPSYYFTSNMPNAYYEWEFVNEAGSTMIPGIPASGDNFIAGFQTYNDGNEPLIGKYRVRASYSFANLTCNDYQWQEFLIVILPTPDIPTVVPVHQEICSGESIEDIVFSSNIDDVIYKWTRISGNIPEIPVTGEGNITGMVIENTGSIMIEAIYEVTPILNYPQYPAYTCPGSPSQFSIAVLPQPHINTIPEMIYCDGELTQGFEFGNTSGVVYSWQLTNGVNVGLAENGQGPLPAFIAANNTNEVLESIYEVTATFSMYGHECTNSATFSIVVNPIPSVELNIGPYTFCVDDITEAIDFVSEFASLNNPVGTVYEWQFVSGNNIGLGQTFGTNVIPSFTPENNGTEQATAIFSIKAIFENCSSVERNFMITVNPKPYVTSNLHGGTRCSGDNFEYMITASIPVTEISWERLPHPDINNNEGALGVSPYINEILYNTGTSNVTVTYLISMKVGDCEYENIAEIELIVIPNFDLNIGSVFTVCNGESAVNIEYEDLNLEGAQYKLLFSSEAIAAGFVNIPQYIELPSTNIIVPVPQTADLGNYSATLSVRFGSCERDYDIIITINTFPIITNMSDATLYYCDNDKMELFVETEGVVDYQWFFNGSVVSTDSHYTEDFDITKAGEYIVEVSNECGTLTFTFEVLRNPIIIELKWNDVLYIDNTGNKYVSYQWYKDGYPITQYGTSQYYTEHGGFTFESEFNVRAYKADGTYDEACPIIPNVTEGMAPKLTVYPNPVQSGNSVTLLLELPENELPDAIAYIFDINGKKIGEYQLVDYSTKVRVNFAAGTYMVRVYTKSGNEFVSKIIVQK
ncbi:MAG: T9SS type A sorting domain-containing protein [Bacteroidales bacterium]|jgi:hypothetical protein|nr:T9SS type A sorting domain-containing protein [Bacteroidales bacterium]